MSMGAFLDSALTDERLHAVPHSLGQQARRWLYGTDDVSRMLDDLADTQLGKRHGRARAVVDTFLSGEIVNVRLPPSKNVSAHAALLEDRDDEIWEFRARDPFPGIRIFGRFVDKDHFVALRWAYKEECETDEEYAYWKIQTKIEWAKFFAVLLPFRGVRARDYVSNCVSF